MTTVSCRRVLVLCVLLPLSLFAATPEPKVIDLWPEGVPDLKPDATPEKDEGGRYSNIHHPTLTVYAPEAEKANGTAIVFAAGGGY